jgi:hypothetical protein
MGQSASGCCAPPVYSPPPPPRTGCCTPPPNLVVKVPGVSVAASSVSVGASSTAVAAAGVSTRLSSGVVVSGSAGASGSTYVRGGGGAGVFAGGGVALGTIAGLQVDGGYETRMVEEEVAMTEQYCIDRIREKLTLRPVQALCIDDTNTPHPASRVDAETTVDRGYRGELYRCMSGTHMQVTLGEMTNGEASFASGETFSCLKGEALFHEAGGKLVCRTQAPERNCNERSLLRRHGPGVKLIEVSAQEAYCEPATRQRLERIQKEVRVPVSAPVGNLVLDGGVGGF